MEGVSLPNTVKRPSDTSKGNAMEYKTPEMTMKVRNLISNVPSIEAKTEKAEIRGTSLPGYERGGKNNEWPGKDYYFPKSLEGSLADIQKTLDEAIHVAIESAKAKAMENIRNANEKIADKFPDIVEAFPLPAFRKVESFSLMSYVKSAVHDGAVNRWYEANGLAIGSAPIDGDTQADFDF
jgi:hypothetical protein